jgi:hypothetical protein
LVKRLYKNIKGSLTIEAAVIVPTVLLCLIALIYICLIMYQQVYLQSVANTAAERGASAWSNPSKDMFIGQIKAEDFKNVSLYWRLAEVLPIGNASKAKKSKVEEYVRYSLKKYSLFGKGPDNKEVINSGESKLTATCDVDDCIIYKKVLVSVTEEYSIPLGGSLLKAFGFNDKFTLKAEAQAVVNEPAEFIRNTDFVVDTIRELDTKGGGTLTETWNKINGTFSKLSGRLKDFLKD